MGRYEIISADSHVNPPPTFWKEYLPPSLRQHAPEVESTDAGDFVVFEGSRTPFRILDSLAGTKAEDYKFSGRMSEARAGGWDPRERLKDMDIDGVDAEILYGGGPLKTDNLELAIASYRAYNAWLADFCKVDSERLFGIAYLPLWDIDQALDEARYAASIGLRGVLIPATPPDGGDYIESKYAGFWSALEEMGLPLHMHVGVGTKRKARVGSGAHFLSDMTMSKLALVEPLAQFIFSGVTERHPNLQVVVVESGLGWAAFVINYMDHLWERHRFWTKSELQEPPSYYFRRQFRGTFLDDPVAVDQRHTLGIQCIMWSSDYPHSETTWPKSREVIEEHFRHVPDDEKRRMICGNVMELYRIE